MPNRSPGQSRSDAVSRFAALLVDKPAGPTSHEVVDFVRWALREKSVGHCGTLDPAATGLLVVCIGRATRLAQTLSAADKTYEARFRLGRSTTTDDAQGDTVDEAEVGEGVWTGGVAELEGLEGLHHLAPPAYSAVKVDGVRAHALARKGESPALDPRPMEVLSVRQARREGDELLATLHVSKGSYVRSLAVELGRRLGVPAHLGGLRRIACGPATLQSGPSGALGLSAAPRPVVAGRPPQWRLRPEGAEDRDSCGQALEAHLVDPVPMLPIPSCPIDDASAALLLQGKTVPGPPAGPVVTRGALIALVGSETSAIHVALAEVGEDGALKPKRVLPRGA